MARKSDEKVPPYNHDNDKTEECIAAQWEDASADRVFRMPAEAFRLVDPVTAEVFRMVPGTPPVRMLTGFTKGTKRPVFVDLELGIAPGSDMLKPDGMPAAFDREVFLAVCSILKAGNIEFTSRQIYRVLTGGARAGSGSLLLVDESLSRLRSVWVILNQHGQPAAGSGYGSLRESCSPVLDTIEIRADEMKSGTCRYRIGTKPELLRYAEEHRQISAAELHLLSVPGVSNSKETICIRGYLLQRILGIKNRRNHLKSDRILFETLFRECGINDRSKDARSRRRETIKRILVFWKSEGFLEDFEFEKEEGRSHQYRSIRIQCGRKGR